MCPHENPWGGGGIFQECLCDFKMRFIINEKSALELACESHVSHHSLDNFKGKFCIRTTISSSDAVEVTGRITVRLQGNL